MLYVLILVLTFMCGDSRASDTRIGVRAGGSFASVNFKPRYAYDVLARVGPYLGVAFEMPVGRNSNTDLRIEAAYIQKGWRERIYYANYYETSQIVLKEYAVTPVVVYSFPSGSITPSLQLGIEISSVGETAGYLKKDGVTTRVNIDLWNDYNISGILGGGLEFGGRLKGTTVDGRFSFGVTNMYSGPADYEATTVAFYLTAARFFRL